MFNKKQIKDLIEKLDKLKANWTNQVHEIALLKQENARLTSALAATGKFNYTVDDIKCGLKATFFDCPHERVIVEQDGKWTAMTVIRDEKGEVARMVRTECGWETKENLLAYMKSANYRIDV